MNAGLILAGGKSERLSSSVPKQFIKVGGKLLIEYCLNVFNQCNLIDIICIVAPNEWHGKLGNYIYVLHGKSRQHSIYNGLLTLQLYNPKKVIIHDAARPLLTIAEIDDCINASANFDGATPVVPVNDTIYHSMDGKVINDTLNRDELYAGQTPECYNFQKYLDAHKTLLDSELTNIRGSSEIAIKRGMNIALCKGNVNNFKITNQADLDRFMAIVERNDIL